VGKSRLVEELERAFAEEEGKKTARPAGQRAAGAAPI
jgi:hypothetical protein